MANRERRPRRLAIPALAVALFVMLVPSVAPAQSFDLPPHVGGADSSYSVVTDLDQFESTLHSDTDYDDHVFVPFDAPWRDPDCCTAAWGWQLLPDGLIYPSYLAGRRESRFASHIVNESDQGWLWDITLGGRVGLVRYGTFDQVRPQGWQLDVEGAAFPRLDLDSENELIAADFRFGVPLSYSQGPVGFKFAYYHLSSHIGDEIIFRDAITTRINFSRDVLLFGMHYWVSELLRLYAEAGYGVYADEGTEPWEFQFGFDFVAASAVIGTAVPFFAINGHLREEVNFGGNVNVETGLAWRGDLNGHLLRAGLAYFNGKSVQFSFVDEHEEQFAFAIWYDY